MPALMSHHIVLAVVVLVVVLVIGKAADARREPGPKLVPKTLFTCNEKLFM
jgi:hypothetical protein